LQGVADKLGVTYSADGDNADTAESLTTKIVAVTPTQTQLNAMTVEQLQIFASLIELTYDYTNKTDLIALILAEYTE
jgi:hypothetical protein